MINANGSATATIGATKALSAGTTEIVLER
jgi:hypothetical protein